MKIVAQQEYSARLTASHHPASAAIISFARPVLLPARTWLACLLVLLAFAGFAAAPTLADTPASQPATRPAKFFNLEVHGNRVIFIIDLSGSTLDTAKIVKAETLATVATLPVATEFNIITVTDLLHPLFPKPERATPATKKSAADLYAKLPGPGSQDDLLSPYQAAFQKAFAMKPDAIYFVTDGHFDPRLSDQIRTLNARNTVAVNTIALLNREPSYEEQLKNVAKANHGQYHFFSQKEVTTVSRIVSSPGDHNMIATSGPTSTIPGPPVSFFGVKAHGKRIIFILDHSGSTLDHFDFLRRETEKSVMNLIPTQQFNVIMFSENVTNLFPNLRLAHPEIKHQLQLALDKIRAQGQNDDLLAPFQKALETAFAQKPDTIFFLTDGHLDPKLLPIIQKLNADKSTHIHTLAFVNDKPAYQAQLKQIAQENAGTFKFIAEKDLAK